MVHVVRFQRKAGCAVPLGEPSISCKQGFVQYLQIIYGKPLSFRIYTIPLKSVTRPIAVLKIHSEE